MEERRKRVERDEIKKKKKIVDLADIIKLRYFESETQIATNNMVRVFHLSEKL